MPDSFGKRNREKIRAEKAQSKDARRIERSQRRRGLLPPLPPPEDEPTPSESPVEPTVS
jgi:hypothetical protein